MIWHKYVNAALQKKSYSHQCVLGCGLCLTLMLFSCILRQVKAHEEAQGTQEKRVEKAGGEGQKRERRAGKVELLVKRRRKTIWPRFFPSASLGHYRR